MIKLSEEKLNAERSRLKSMSEFEDKFIDFTIAGVDEAGRGPLAGPVVVGCVVLDRDKEILFLNDSKKLSEKRRNELYDEIIEKSLAYGIGIVNEKIIDEINILNATHIAMKDAYEKVSACGLVVCVICLLFSSLG